MLTTPRSGSYWLGSLATNTGSMGKLEEWVDEHFLGRSLDGLDVESFISLLLDKASTENGRFALKLFPRHLYNVHVKLGIDLISELRRNHDVTLAFLRRGDTLRQAISLVRAADSDQWRSDQNKKNDARYDFGKICVAYFYINRNNDFWRTYFELKDISFMEFNYDALLLNPHPWLDFLSSSLDVDIAAEFETDLQVQRDEVTESWVTRFREDIAESDIIGAAAPSNQYSRTFSNLVKFLRKEGFKTAPFNFSTKARM